MVRLRVGVGVVASAGGGGAAAAALSAAGGGARTSRTSRILPLPPPLAGGVSASCARMMPTMRVSCENHCKPLICFPSSTTEKRAVSSVLSW
eukprot:jgi/Chrpa1/27607/Chrysochromulina_OHIO_Genome00011750-RA